MLDLDQRHAEHVGDPKPVRLGGVVYDLPPRMPLLVAVWLDRGDWDKALGVLFGDENVDTVAALLDKDDLIAINRELYGGDTGESQASSGSSKTNGARSKRTSAGATEDSTSGKRASV